MPRKLWTVTCPSPALSPMFLTPPAAPPLQERLQVSGPEAATPPLPQPLLRKFLAYARAHVQPALSTEAAATLQEFYLGLRQQVRQRPIAFICSGGWVGW